MFTPQDLQTAALALATALEIKKPERLLRTSGSLKAFLIIVLSYDDFLTLRADDAKLQEILGEAHADKLGAIEDMQEGRCSSHAIIRGLTRTSVQGCEKLKWGESKALSAGNSTTPRAAVKAKRTVKSKPPFASEHAGERFWVTKLSADQAKHKREVLGELQTTLPGIRFHSHTHTQDGGHVEIYCKTSDVEQLAEEEFNTSPKI